MRVAFLLMNRPVFIKAAVAVVLGGAAASPAGAADFHPINGITTSSTGDLWPVSNLIQGPGLGFANAEPHDQTGSGSSALWVTGAPGGFPSDYLAVAGVPVLIFDLGSDVALSEISVWGYSTTNANGVSRFSLRFATAAEGTENFGSSISIRPAFNPMIGATSRQSFSFGQSVTARYVEMSCEDNFYSNGGNGPPPGGDRVGLGEVAFEVVAPPSGPLIDLSANVGLDLDGSVQTFDVPIGNLGGTEVLTINGTSFTGVHAEAFSVLSAPAFLAPGGNGIIQVSFNPTGLSGTISAGLQVQSTDPDTPTAVVGLSGFLHDPKLVVARNYDFGEFAAAEGAQSGSLPFSNAGGGRTLTVSDTSISGADANHFTVTATPSNLLPLTTGFISLSFDPLGEEGEFDAQLTITSNDAADSTAIVNLAARVGDVIPNSGVRINEFMASNGLTLSDGDGNSSDWIEIYNAGPGGADLTGYYLTDEADNLEKWRFPSTTIIPANGYLLVFASGQRSDDYVDAGGFLHTNFRLGTSGEYLALVEGNGVTVVSEFGPNFPPQFNDVSYGTFQSGGSVRNLIGDSDAEVLIPTNGSLGNTWQVDSFTPGADWISGTGQGVGYDIGQDYDQYITTDVESGMRGQGTSAFIRLPFTLANPLAVTALSFSFRYDDGFVAYLNGEEIANRNAPNLPAWNDVANGSVNENTNTGTIDVSAFRGELQQGDNVFAIHGLNRSTGSSDFLIDVSLEASATGSGPLSFGYLSSPTPGLPNSEATTPGPVIQNVSHFPAQQPLSQEDIEVTAEVAPRLATITTVNLVYRVDFGPEVVIPMAAGVGSYTGTIPASAYRSGDMVRWYVSAADADGNVGRAPAFLDRTGNNQSPEYFGTVVRNARLVSQLPIFQWFTQSEAAANSRSGTRASVYFDGRFYDNIFVRQRGGASNGNSQKFDFNKGDDLYVNSEMSSVGEINMNERGSDSSYVRQTLAFEAYEMAGNAACKSALWYMQLNGTFDRVGVFIEQVDEDFLDRNGYDPDSDLYKFVQRSNLNPVFFDTVTGIEKKTGDKNDLTTVQNLVAGLNRRTSTARRRYAIDNLDLPQVVNYLAVRSITQDADDVRKNFYGYIDNRGDQRWRIFPWDKDWTFGVTGDGGTHLPHPFFGDEEHAKQNANQWNVLYDVLFEETTTQRLYLRRLRTVMDEVLELSATPQGRRYFENRAAEIIAPASPPLSSNISSVNNYLNSRRSVLFNNYPSLIPASQPANPDIRITAAEHNPVSTNQDEEYIVLTNQEATEIDISGWKITGGVEFTFEPGTVIERRGELYLSPDTLAFRNRSTSPTGNEERLVVGPYAGHLSNFGETLNLLNTAEGIVSVFRTPINPSDTQRYLVVSELMYHPADPNPDAEFIELMNISDSVTLDLSGVHFTAGIDYTFPVGTMLGPGARIVVSFPDFQNGSRLNNGSDRIKLEDATSSTIREFTYDDEAPWPTGSDGGGFSLVLRNPVSNPDHNDPANWRESTRQGGNPGGSDAVFFAGNPNDDLDRDGLGALLEHATGSSDRVPNGSPVSLTTTGDGRFALTLQMNQAADDVTHRIELSSDLVNWTDASARFSLLSFTNHGDGTGTLTYQSDPGLVSAALRRHFVRVEFSSEP